MKIGQMLLFNNHGRKESKTGFSWAHTVCQVPSYTLSWLILWGNGKRVQASLFLFHLWGNWLSERKGDLPKVIMASRFRTQTRICMQRLCSSHLTWFLRAKSPSDFSTAIELYKKNPFHWPSSWFSASSPIYITNTDLPWILGAGQVLSYPFFRVENWGWESWRDLPSVTQSVGRMGVLLFPSESSLQPEGEPETPRLPCSGSSCPLL